MAQQGQSVGNKEIRDKAISFDKLNVDLQSKINGLGTAVLQTNNKNIREAINELFQSGVDMQNIAKSALNAAGISYSNDQLRTLVQTMGNNLYTKDMHSSFVNKLNSVSGSTIASNNNTFNELVNMIENVTKPQVQTKIVNTLNDWTHNEASSVKPDDTIGYIDFNYNGSLAVRLEITQWNKANNYDWYITFVRIYNKNINYIQINGLTNGFYDYRVDGTTTARNNDPSIIQIFRSNSTAALLTTYNDNTISSATFTDLGEIYLLANGSTTDGHGRKVNRGFGITIQ